MFAVGTLVAAIEVVRGAFILAASSTEASIQLNLIWITLQCTLGIVVTNLPILRPLFFSRSFANHGSTGHVTGTTNGTSGGVAWSKGPRTKGIPLYDVAEYGGHAIVSTGDIGQDNSLEAGMILKSVEVRVHSESVASSIHSGRNESKFFN